MLGAVVDDPLSQHRPDAGQRVEVGDGGGVEVQQAAGTGGSSGSRRLRSTGDADRELLAVGEERGCVDRRRVRPGQQSTGSRHGVCHT